MELGCCSNVVHCSFLLLVEDDLVSVFGDEGLIVLKIVKNLLASIVSAMIVQNNYMEIVIVLHHYTFYVLHVPHILIVVHGRHYNADRQLGVETYIVLLFIILLFLQGLLRYH